MNPTTGTTRSRFDHRLFLASEGSDLVAYMEPLVNDPATVADAASLTVLLEGLADFGEYHLVYAIEFGTDRMPALYAAEVAKCLAHRCQSVRLAAHRALSRLPEVAISDRLIEACRGVIARGGPEAEVGDLPGILASRPLRPANR